MPARLVAGGNGAARLDPSAGLLLTGPFESSVEITQGCQPITEPMTITKAQGNLILAINDRPAFEIFAKVIKGPLIEDVRRALAFVFVGLPSDSCRNSVGPGEYLTLTVARGALRSMGFPISKLPISETR